MTLHIVFVVNGRIVPESLWDAIETAYILGARTLVPIHYAVKPIPLLLPTPGCEHDLLRLAKDAPNMEHCLLADRQEMAICIVEKSTRHPALFSSTVMRR